MNSIEQVYEDSAASEERLAESGVLDNRAPERICFGEGHQNCSTSILISYRLLRGQGIIDSALSWAKGANLCESVSQRIVYIM